MDKATLELVTKRKPKFLTVFSTSEAWRVSIKMREIKDARPKPETSSLRTMMKLARWAYKLDKKQRADAVNRICFPYLGMVKTSRHES